MAKKDFVNVRVFDWPGLNAGCSCCSPGTCGPEYFSVKQKSAELKEALEAAFPGRTSLDYVDLLISPEDMMSDAGRVLTSGQYPSPLVLIDGEPRFAGSILVDKIVKEVGVILNS